MDLKLTGLEGYMVIPRGGLSLGFTRLDKCGLECWDGQMESRTSGLRGNRPVHLELEIVIK